MQMKTFRLCPVTVLRFTPLLAQENLPKYQVVIVGRITPDVYAEKRSPGWLGLPAGGGVESGILMKVMRPRAGKESQYWEWCFRSCSQVFNLSPRVPWSKTKWIVINSRCHGDTGITPRQSRKNKPHAQANGM